MSFNEQEHSIVGRMAITGLLAGLLLAPPHASASETTLELEDIPTRLILPSDPIAYPDPICLGCKIVTQRVSASSDGDDATAVLTVTYLDDATPTFVGDIVLTVFLPATEEYRDMTLDGVLLVDGQTTELLVTADPDWTWAEVEWVLVEMHAQ